MLAKLLTILLTLIIATPAYAAIGDMGGPSMGGYQSPAPRTVPYITLSTSPYLTTERVLTAGTGVTLTDGGAGGNLTLSISSPVATTNGGTGLSALGTANQVLGVNAAGGALEYKTLTAGTGISVTHAAGSVTIASSGGSVFGGDGTASRALPTSGAAEGEYFVTNWTSVGTCTWTNVRVHCTGTFTLNHAVTVAGGLKGGSNGALGTSSDFAGARGCGPGGGSSAGGNGYGSGGGGYGGAGGTGGGAAGAGAAGGPAYVGPPYMGSGGGQACIRYGTSADGGDGGGGCYIAAVGAVAINANITANGVGGTASGGGGNQASGGGAGGHIEVLSRTSVYIDTGVTLSANGGAGANSTSAGGGAGGGGRIIVWAPSVTNNGTLSVSGGAAGTGGATPATAGSAGVATIITGNPGERE